MRDTDLHKFSLRVANISDGYEKENTELKKEYIKKSIESIVSIMMAVPGFKGSFGTGYPFYALGKDFSGDLPIIEEQLSYNSKLVSAAVESRLSTWSCEKCLEEKGPLMKDLKVICKPCPKIDKELKPRKIINRLPDLDIWLVVDDNLYEESKKILATYLQAYHIEPSDNDVLGTINKVESIVTDLQEGRFPSEILPIDVHIIRYSELDNLIKEAPNETIKAYSNGELPYLPIRPISWRKRWQHDDEAYNFVFDFLCSMTPFNFDEELLGNLIESRNIIANCFTSEELDDIFESISSDAVRRRFATKPLMRLYRKRVSEWKN